MQTATSTLQVEIDSVLQLSKVRNLPWGALLTHNEYNNNVLVCIENKNLDNMGCIVISEPLVGLARQLAQF